MKPAQLPLILPGLGMLAILAATPLAAQNSATSCTLTYERADNPFAGHGKPAGNLGRETATVPVGQSLLFKSEWAHEKRRNNGQTFYGSHLRRATNTGQQKVELTVFQFALPRQGTQVLTHWTAVGLNPGETKLFLHDLKGVHCREPGRTDVCMLEYERTAVDLDLPDKSDNNLGPEQLTLQPGQRKAFSTDRRYVRQRGTDDNRYGSNLRRAFSKSDRDLRLLVRFGPRTDWVTISHRQGFHHYFVGDLVEVHCPA